jgi:hypothetical protein
MPSSQSRRPSNVQIRAQRRPDCRPITHRCMGAQPSVPEPQTDPWVPVPDSRQRAPND